MIFRHYSLVPWDAERWPNFTASEFACRHCGEYYHDPDSLDRLHMARTIVGKPFKINCGHRCFIWNSDRRVRGANKSEHLRMAFDIDLAGHDRHKLKVILREVGFMAFGYYISFIHVDMRRLNYWPAAWFGKGAKSSWL